MTKTTLSKIEKELEEERKEVRSIEKDIGKLEQKLLEKIPGHFSKRDIIAAFFGSLIIGMTFILKGATLTTALSLNSFNIIAIILFTTAVLLLEIYYVSYVRVKDKKTRRPGQFIAKRFFTMYIIAFISSFLLVYLLAINQRAATSMEVIKVIILMSMPCAIGAAIPTLLKKY